MTSKIEYIQLDLFTKNFKALAKKFKTLQEDLEVVKKNAIELFHCCKLDNQSIVLLKSHEHIAIYKLRKFACKSLKGRGAKSGIRIIYSFNSVKMQVTFIEIYFKADQTNETKNLIESFLALPL